jgi:hypothetical protein
MVLSFSSNAPIPLSIFPHASPFVCFSVDQLLREGRRRYGIHKSLRCGAVQLMHTYRPLTANIAKHQHTGPDKPAQMQPVTVPRTI